MPSAHVLGGAGQPSVHVTGSILPRIRPGMNGCRRLSPAFKILAVQVGCHLGVCCLRGASRPSDGTWLDVDMLTKGNHKMRRSRGLWVGVTSIAMVLVVGCSSAATPSTTKASASSPDGSTSHGENVNASGPPVRGGTLHMLGVGDIDYMDPDISHYSTPHSTANSRQSTDLPCVASGRARHPAWRAPQHPALCAVCRVANWLPV